MPPPADHPSPELTSGDFVRLAWKRLREMRTVFQLLVVIAAAALICTVVPQGESPEQYHSRYHWFLANIILRLGLDHVHSATWFLALIGVLLLSLVACSSRLWQEAALRWGVPEADAAARKVKASGSLSAASKVSLERAADQVRRAARARGFHTRALPAAGPGAVLYLCKHRLSAWGQALAHYAVFLIALGSVLGAIPGLSLDQTIGIQEGDVYSAPDGRLPFSVAVDRFRIEQDPASGSVQNYYSEVRLLEAGNEVARGIISVNHPLRYRGYFLSQSDWSLGEARVEVSRGGKTEQVAYPLSRGGCPEMGSEAMWGVAEADARRLLASGDAALVPTAFCADARREGKQVVALNSEYPGTPAMSLTYVSGLPSMAGPPAPAHGMAPHAMKDLGWLMVGDTAPLGDGGRAKFVAVTKVTGLGVRKDVGLPLVWIGFVASMVGLVMIFYFPLQRSLVALEADGPERTVVTMGLYGRSGDLVDEANEVWTGIVEQLGARPLATGASEVNEEG